jgi:hypothetical protein
VNVYIYSDEEVRQAALDTANQIRARLELPPVDHLYKGRIANASSCPITNTIYDDDLSRDYAVVETIPGSIGVWKKVSFTPLIRHDADEATRQFIFRFDQGNYPDLTAKE